MNLTSRSSDLVDLGCIQALGFFFFFNLQDGLFLPVEMLKAAKVHASLIAATLRMEKIKIIFSCNITEEQWTQRSPNELNPGE